jgi:hypothetical protein
VQLYYVFRASSGPVESPTSDRVCIARAGDMVQVQAMLGSWGAGELIAQKTTFFGDSLTVNAGSGVTPGFGKYTMATFDDWCAAKLTPAPTSQATVCGCGDRSSPMCGAALRACVSFDSRMMGRIGEKGAAQYDMNDMTWDVYPAPGGAIGEWTVGSMVVKATGQATGPMCGINRFTVDGGKITKVNIVLSADDTAQLEALSNNVAHVRTAPFPRFTSLNRQALV